MRSALGRLGSLLALGALTLGGLVSAPGGAAPPRDRASAGFARVVAWEGGVTLACWLPVGETDAEVRVRWDGRGYDWGPNGAGGLGRVSGRFKISDWTYSSADAGKVGRVVSLTMSRDWYVYVIAGSQFGITREVVVPVRSLNQCAADRATSAVATSVGQAARAGRACVSKKEFRKIKRGMTPAKVKKVVGANGRKVTSASYSLVRRYQQCRGSSSVVVNFQRAKEKSPNKVVSRFR